MKNVVAGAYPPTIAGILWDNCIPHDLDILKIDIDSYDYDVSEAILKHGYRPKVFAAEVGRQQLPAGRPRCPPPACRCPPLS